MAWSWRRRPGARWRRGPAMRAFATHNFTQRSELSLLAAWNLNRIMGSGRVDVLHYNTPRPILAGKLAAWISGVPILVASRRVNFPLRSRFSRIKYNRLLDRVVTVSGSIQRTLVQNGIRPERISVIYEGVDLPAIDGLPPTSVLPAHSGLVVGVVAHLSPEKGHVTVLKAAARLRERFPEVTYVFVGGGDRRQMLEERARALAIADRVSLHRFSAGQRRDDGGIRRLLPGVAVRGPQLRHSRRNGPAAPRGGHSCRGESRSWWWMGVQVCWSPPGGRTNWPRRWPRCFRPPR